MKTLKTSLIPALVVGALALAPAQAKADGLKDFLDGLITVNVNIDDFDNLVYINDVNILDYNYVNVSDLLNDVDIALLEVAIENVPVASFNQGLLDYVLQSFSILDASQVVVGVLSDQGIIYYLDGGQ